MPRERPRFSELLADRRRRLGLSLTQASQVLRLKEQVLVAFEEGDFEQMPKSGYAQGMLSSYARYLGLNPKQITDQYAADLDAYLRSNGGSLFGRGTVVSRETSPGGVGTPTPRYQGARGLLPTSGGLAGDYGAYATTSTVRRGGQRAGMDMPTSETAAPYATRQRYTSDAEPRYTRRTPQGSARPRAPRGGERLSTRAGTRVTAGSSPRGYERDRVTTRRVGSGQYTDDLRYGDVRPYQAASTTPGRRGSRDIASTRRPNVRRQRPGSAPPRHTGVIGVLEAFFSDPTRTVAVVVIIAVALLTAFLVTSVRGCIANQTSTGRVVEVTQADAPDADTTSDTDTTDTDEQALADAAAARGEQTVPSETVVVVSVGDGMVSWVEIDSDGVVAIADTVTGPWEESFTVADTITIRVGDTASVTVTENGEQRQFDAHTSGIGTITIRNAAKAAAEAAGESVASEVDARPEDASSVDASDADAGDYDAYDSSTYDDGYDDYDDGYDY